MTPPPPRHRPQRRHPGGLGEQPTQRMRPVSGQQPYGERQPSAQQPRYGRHSGGVRHSPRSRPRRLSDQTAVVTGLLAVAALLVAGLGAWVIAKGDGTDDAGGDQPAATAQAPATAQGRTSGAVPGAAVDAKAGDCIKVNDAGKTNADVETIDCADRAAVYKVGIREYGRGGDCPGENYVKYTEQDSLLLCLTLNARQGECFHESEEQDTRVPCDSPDASYEVGAVYDGEEDAARCGERDASNALTYPRPPLTICRLDIG
ncbi:MAG TPA: hypothetical protein VGP26_21865 [Actinophytocola sp.]|jgi:hypothetical protein|nr:hypothetical protein [Actinophytocola sp.]